MRRGDKRISALSQSSPLRLGLDECQGKRGRDERGPNPGLWAPAAVRPHEHWGLKWFEGEGESKGGGRERKKKNKTNRRKEKTIMREYGT